VTTTVVTPEYTTTTTSISENLTDSGNILTNSTFDDPDKAGEQFGSTGWTVSNGTGSHNSNPNLPSNSTNRPSTGFGIHRQT
jgi:hypothetical protein